jgi:ATP-dependent helicase YprA (DUF1998 family)
MPQNYNIQTPFNVNVIALLAPTASGKTEVLETIALQIALDGKKAGFETTKVIMVYPMREFMKDHIKRFINELIYINNYIPTPPITIGLLNEDTPRIDDSKDKIENFLQILFPQFTCPRCNAEINWSRQQNDIVIQCSNGHKFDFIRVTRKALRETPPDILLITPDELNIVMRVMRERKSDYAKVFGLADNVKGFPLLIVMDEPHLYSGMLGANVSFIVRELRLLIRSVASWKYNVDYEPLIIVSSATIPNPHVFLAKLFIVDPSSIEVVQASRSQQISQSSTKGLVALLPTPEWGIRNAEVEIIPLLAAILPPDKRRILVFVDSVERANRVVYKMRDYIKRPSGFWDEYDVCRHVGTIFDASACPNGVPDPNFINIQPLTAKMDTGLRNKIAEEFRAGKINVLVATSALEVGIDIGDVDIAVLLCLPPTPINFEQRVGRVGRRGQPSLVIVIGNENSGVDVFYLSSQRRLTDYLTNKRNYEIPLNPANPYIVRAYAGNFISSLLWRSPKVKKPYQYRINEYINIAIDLPIKMFQNSKDKGLQLITKYLNDVGKDLKEQLRLLVEALPGGFKSREEIPFDDSENWRKVSKRWSCKLESRYRLLGTSTPIEKIRSMGREVKLEFELSIGKTKDKTLFTLHDDVLLAISSYSLSTLPAFDDKAYVFNGKLPPDRRLRGTVTLKPIQLGQRYEIVPFELTGGLFIPILPTQDLNDFRNALERVIQTLSLLESISSIYIGNVGHCRLFAKRVKSLKATLENYIENVLDQVINTRRLLTHSLKVVSPELLVFRPIEPICIVTNNDVLECLEKALKAKLESARQYLFYYEVDKNRFLSKIGIVNVRRSSTGYSMELLENINVKGNVEYDLSRRDLIITTPQGSTTYKQLVSQLSQQTNRLDSNVVNLVVTYPITFATVLPSERGIIDLKQGQNGVEVSLETIQLFYANVGFSIGAPAPGRGLSTLKPKFIDKKDDPGMIAEKFETYAVRISIDWDIWFKNVIKDSLRFQQILSQDLSNIGVSQPAMPLHNTFALTVAHSLAHVILNYHSLYTGGERRDLNEVLAVETENSIVRKVHVYLYDMVPGGNGVSELLYEYLNDILNDATNVMIERHRKLKCLSARQPSECFFGQPGDAILAGWPQCSYGNVAISRLWLLRFLASHSGTDLNKWITQGGNITVSFP